MICSSDIKPKRFDTVEFHTRAIQRVITRIRQNVDEGITLTEMASLAHMSPFHFIRTFRQVTGVPPRRFLSALRIEAATRMLLETDNPVTTICFDVGYTSLGTFIRRFSCVLGVSPSKLRTSRKSPVKDLLAEPRTATHAVGPVAPQEQGLRGRVLAPDGFAGVIFIGLFPTPIPEGKPLACAASSPEGDFTLSNVPKGRHYIFALGIPWPATVGDYFSHELTLRGGGRPVEVGADLLYTEEIVLRPALATDPPILVNFPTLLKKAWGPHTSPDTVAISA